jgi:alkylation response protein AidB-like acyl-CoA dehydrogenase
MEAIEEHATDELKQLYLPKMVSGEWTGTMNLTEPQAGSDLSGVKTQAGPIGDGTYRSSATKIYITYGEHDITDNIVHLVLARLPDAPEGTRGISLFLVPKFLSTTTARWASATTCLHRARAQARHSRLADLHHDLWRRQVRRRAGRHRLAGRRGEPRPPACSR